MNLGELKSPVFSLVAAENKAKDFIHKLTRGQYIEKKIYSTACELLDIL